MLLIPPKNDKEYVNELVQIIVKFTPEQHKRFHSRVNYWYASQNPNWNNLSLDEQMDWLDKNEVKPRTLDLLEKYIEEALME